MDWETLLCDLWSKWWPLSVGAGIWGASRLLASAVGWWRREPAGPDLCRDILARLRRGRWQANTYGGITEEGGGLELRWHPDFLRAEVRAGGSDITAGLTQRELRRVDRAARQVKAGVERRRAAEHAAEIRQLGEANLRRASAPPTPPKSPTAIKDAIGRERTDALIHDLAKDRDHWKGRYRIAEAELERTAAEVACLQSDLDEARSADAAARRILDAHAAGAAAPEMKDMVARAEKAEVERDLARVQRGGWKYRAEEAEGALAEARARAKSAEAIMVRLTAERDVAHAGTGRPVRVRIGAGSEPSPDPGSGEMLTPGT